MDAKLRNKFMSVSNLEQTLSQLKHWNTYVVHNWDKRQTAFVAQNWNHLRNLFLKEFLFCVYGDQLTISVKNFDHCLFAEKVSLGAEN